MKSTPLKPSLKKMKRSPLRPRSKKRAEFYRVERVPFVKAYLRAHPWCERCTFPYHPSGEPRRMNRSVDVHELVRRGQGGSTVDEDNVVALCRECHDWIGANPRLATEQGWARHKKWMEATP